MSKQQHCCDCAEPLTPGEQLKGYTICLNCGASNAVQPAPLLLPDETYINEHGGKQSKVAYRMDLSMWRAILHLAHISKYGAEKYGDWNWHKITANEHLNHALIHIAAHQLGDTTEDHAGHAAWRIMAWLDTLLSERHRETPKTSA